MNIHFCEKLFLVLSFIAMSLPLTGRELKKFREDSVLRDANMGGWQGVFQRNKDAVVQIFACANQHDVMEPFRTVNDVIKCGSGFFISSDGYILTNFHVVSDQIEITIQSPLMGKERLAVNYVGGCPGRDVALLHLTAESKKRMHAVLGSDDVPCIALGDSDRLMEAQGIIVMGYPLGEQELKISFGYVAGRQTTSSGECIQTTAPINAGNSGGPVCNEAGEVVCICVSKIVNAECVGFLIPINNVKILLAEMYKSKIVRLPFWGMRLLPTSDALLEYVHCPTAGGIYIKRILKGSMAEDVGLAKGDVIVAVDGMVLDNFGFLARPAAAKLNIFDYVNRLPFGSKIVLDIYRAGVKKTVSAVLKNRDPFKLDQVFYGFEDIPPYEVFGGMVVSELTQNHFDYAARYAPYGDVSQILRYSADKYYADQRLIISSIFQTSALAHQRVMPLSVAILKEVNGRPVSTIEEYRAAILDGATADFFTFKTEGGVFVVLRLDEILQEDDLLATRYGYVPSDLIEEIKKRRAGLL